MATSIDNVKLLNMIRLQTAVLLDALPVKGTSMPYLGGRVQIDKGGQDVPTMWSIAMVFGNAPDPWIWIT